MSWRTTAKAKPTRPISITHPILKFMERETSLKWGRPWKISQNVFPSSKLRSLKPQSLTTRAARNAIRNWRVLNAVTAKFRLRKRRFGFASCRWRMDLTHAGCTSSTLLCRRCCTLPRREASLRGRSVQQSVWTPLETATCNPTPLSASFLLPFDFCHYIFVILFIWIK